MFSLCPLITKVLCAEVSAESIFPVFVPAPGEMTLVRSFCRCLFSPSVHLPPPKEALSQLVDVS